MTDKAAPPDYAPATITTRSVVAGDVLQWRELSGDEADGGARTLKARVLSDRYEVIRRRLDGTVKRSRHMFTLRVIRSYGVDVLKKGSEIERTGYALYGYDPCRASWEDEAAREVVEKEKFERGRAVGIIRYKDMTEEEKARFNSWHGGGQKRLKQARSV